MAKRITKTNPMLIALIHELKKEANVNDAPIWKDIAIRLEKPSKNWSEVNLDRISKYTREKPLILIRGTGGCVDEIISGRLMQDVESHYFVVNSAEEVVEKAFEFL